MKERVSDLSSDLNRASFIAKRGDVIGGNHEAVIYRRKDLDIVVKELIDPNAMNGYRLAVGFLDQDLMARTSFVENLQINVDHKFHVIKLAVIQERVIPLEEEFIRLVKQKSIDTLVDLIKKKVILDREILKKGVFIQDPELKNCGVREDGKVVLIDPGKGVADPSCDEYHLTRMFNRGWTHYSIFMRLQNWGERELRFALPYPHMLSDLYKQETDLNFDPQINASTHLLLGFTSLEDIAAFTGKPYGYLAQEELDEFFPKKIPPHPGIETFGSGHLDEWIVDKDGGWLRRK